MSEKIYHKPLILTFSGGKDSSVCLDLMQKAKVPFEVMHNLTTADAPETIYFMRERFHALELEGIHCEVNFPVYKGKRTSMWNLIPQVMIPPMRIRRYCCTVLKEGGGRNRFIVTGVRWAESVRRKQSRAMFEIYSKDRKNVIILNNDNDEKRMLFETCRPKAKRICNPIVDWTDNDIWDYIREENLPVNELYSCGFSRVGCIGCPMAGKHRYREFQYWPKYKNMYIAAFGRMLEARKAAGKETAWESAQEVFRWWMEEDYVPGQLEMFLGEEMEDD